MLQTLEIILPVSVFFLVGVLLWLLLRSLPMHSLRRRWLMTFAAVTVLPILIIMMVSTLGSVSALDNRRVEQLKMAADFKQAEIATWLTGLATDVEAEAVYIKAVQQTLLTLPAGLVEFQQAYSEQKTHFRQVLKLRPEFESLFVMDTQGRVILSTDTMEERRRYSGETYFQRALVRPYIQPPQYSNVINSARLVIAHPLLDPEGATVGVLAARVSVDALTDLVMAPIGLGEAEMIYLVDEAFNVLTPLPSSTEERYVPNRAIREALTTRSEVSGRYLNQLDQPALALYRWIPDLEAVLVLEVGRGAGLTPVLWVVGINTGVALLTLIAALVVAFFVARRMTRPFGDLLQATADMLEGQPIQIEPGMGDDELSALARNFHQVTEQLQQKIADLEGQVAEQSIDLEQRSAQLEATVRILRQIATVHEDTALLELAVDQLARQFGFYHVAIFLLDESRQYALLYAASSEEGKRMVADRYKVSVDADADSLVGSVAHSGKLRMMLGLDEDLQAVDVAYFPKTKSEILIPLSVRDEVLGVLDLHSLATMPLYDGNTAYLQTIADQIALALDNARLLAETEQRLGEIRQLLQMQSRQDWEQLSAEHPDWGYIYDGVNVKPLAAQPEFSPQLRLSLEGGQEAMGEFKASWEAKVAPDAQDVELARAIIDQASQALESARLFNRTQDALEEVGVLYRSSQAIGSARTPEQVLRAFVDYLIAPGIDRCILALLEPYTTVSDMIIRVAAAWEAGKAHPAVLGDRWAVSKIPVLMKTGLGDAPVQPLAISDVTTTEILDDVSRQVFLNVFRVRACLLVPLAMAGQMLGWLFIESLHTPHTFTEREIRMYRSLADQAAIVLQSIRLLDEVTQRAEYERRITDIAANIRQQTDMEAILQTSIRELGKALKAADGFIQLGFDADPDTGTAHQRSEVEP